MKPIRVLLAAGALAWLAMGMIGCSADFHNPTPNEWDVQIVGDSVFDLSGEIQTDLKTLSGGKLYKDRSVSGAKIAAIVSQLNTALGRTTLKTVISDGGANDILQGSADCDTDPVTQGCVDVLNYVGDEMEIMINNTYAKSPTGGVWLGYYHVKGSEVEKNEAIDYAYTWVYPGIFPSTFTSGSSSWPAVIFGTDLKYLLVDSRPYMTTSDIKSDNIHPTSSGSQKLANQIWAAMVGGAMYR
jgi:hypothetical protein